MDGSDLRVVEGQPLRYLLSVPAAPVPADGWPVLCFLHGYDEAAPLDIQRALTRHGPFQSSSAPQARTSFVVVAPQLPTAGDIWRRYATPVLQLVQDVRAQYAGNPRQTYLSGFSFGGNGVFDLAIEQPSTWAALWSVDPTRVPREDPQRPVWLSFGAVARSRKEGFIRALDLQPAGDGPEGRRLYLDQGEGHVGSARLAYADERIYDWIQSKQLPGPVGAP